MEKNQLKLKYKIGGIEFEAEGPADVVEQQRAAFISGVLPAAVEAMNNTRFVEAEPVYVENKDRKLLTDTVPLIDQNEDFSRTSLASYLSQKGTLSEQDFVLFAAYYDENKNSVKAFSSESVKKYYADARRKPYSNYSVLFGQLVKKGYIMESETTDKAAVKYYTLTCEGIRYIQEYTPKTDIVEKRTRKPRKSALKKESSYSSVVADDLSLDKYPAVKDMKTIKDRVVLALYIVTQEAKGEWFTCTDIDYLLVNIFEISETKRSINRVFEDNRSWFRTENDETKRNGSKHKLLAGAKDYAKKLVAQYKE